MKRIEVLIHNKFSDDELIKIHLRIRPLSSKTILGGKYYLTQNFDTAVSNLLDNKSGKIKQNGLNLSYRLLVQMECDYSKFFVPTADEVISLIPEEYLKEEMGVIGYSIKKANRFSPIHDYSKVPIIVNLYTLKTGAQVPKDIQELPITRFSKQYTPKSIEDD